MQCIRRLLLLLVIVAVSGGALHGLTVNRYLEEAAVRARNRRGWPALRRYARATHNARDRSLAYFVLGYREYQGNFFSAAAADLRQATQFNSSLADWAEYYQALAAQRLNKYAVGIEALDDFSDRYPESPLRVRAAALEASLLIQAGQPQRAINLINAAPGAQPSAASVEALAKAYAAEGNAEKSATIYETLYYDFPLTPEGDDAGRALNQLRARMGASFPKVSDRRKTQRVVSLFQARELERALNGYNDLLQAEPQSSLVGEWTLGRARCLLGLGRYDDAAESLLNPIRGNNDVDAARLALLAHVYERADDGPSMLNTLNLIYQEYPHASSYADALFYAGDYFSRHGFWQTAARYYEIVSQQFPGALWAPQAAWWTAWYHVLDGENSQAAAALEDYLRKYPHSPHLPDAVYWLARIRQQQGHAVQAQDLFRAVAEKFPNSYYGDKARDELMVDHALDGPLPARAYSSPPEIAGRGKQRPNETVLPAGDDSSPPEMLASLGITTTSPALPLLSDEEPARLMQLLRPATTLAELGLRQLASETLNAMTGNHAGDPEYFLAVARLWSEQKKPAAALLAAGRAVPNYQDYLLAELPREEWNLLYPHPYWSAVRIDARANGLNPYLVMGLIRQESAFNPRAISAAGARGLMQMMPSTAAYHVRSRWRRRRVARLLYDPRYNLRVSSRYLGALLRTFNRNPAETVAAYNAGDSRVTEWLTNGKFADSDEFVESIPYADTRVYVESVLRDAAMYRALLTGQAKFSPPNRIEN